MDWIYNKRRELMEEINIWWEGPFTHEAIINDGIDSKKYDNRATDIGLYQVYSSHPLYGADVLVYIGMTIEKGGFRRRLKNRWVIENGNDVENVKIYLGTIVSHSKTMDDKTKKNNIEQAEALLVNALTPAFNSSYIQSVGMFIKDDFQVNNKNNYRSLYPQLSSRYYWKDEEMNFIITDELAREYESKIDNKNNKYGFYINDNIFFGIDYECWKNTNTPLVIGVTKTSVTEEDLEKISEIIWDDEDVYYISTNDNLKTDGVVAEIESKIERVKRLLKK